MKSNSNKQKLRNIHLSKGGTISYQVYDGAWIDKKLYRDEADRIASDFL